jgi:hypothetical protein
MTRMIAACVLVLLVTGCSSSGQDIWANLKSKVGAPMASGSDNSTAAAPAGATAPAKAAPTLPFSYCANCLIDRGGKVVPTSTTVRGDLERVVVEGDMLVFTGWGADVTGGVPAKSVVFVSDGNVVAQIVPNKPRPDVSAALKSPKFNDFGFEARVPKAALGQSTSLWIFGADDKAAPLGKVFQQ